MAEEDHKPDILEIMFEVNRQQIAKINAYCAAGGLERFVETSREFYELNMANIRLLEMMMNRDKAKAKEEERRDANST